MLKSDLLFQMLTDSDIICQLIYEFVVIFFGQEYILQILRMSGEYLLVLMKIIEDISYYMS